MKLSKMNILYFLIIGLTVCSCEKEKLNAPPLTEENTFSCKVDGNLFVAQPNGGLLQFPGILVIGPNWVIRVTNDNNEDIFINLNENPINNQIQIQKADGDQRFFNDENSSVEFVRQNSVFVSNENSGVIDVIEWEDNNKLVLKFQELVLHNKEDPNEKLVLAEGKLNINLETLNK